MQLLEQLLGSKNNIRILRYLVKYQDWEFNISELSRDINMNKGVLSRLVRKLKENNLIKINQKGKIVLFKLNKDNIIIKNLLIPIFKIENNLFNDFIKPKILGLKSRKVLSIILYGSYSKNEFNLVSDLDILLIVKNKNNKLEDQVSEIKKGFLQEDLLVRIDIMTLKEFKRSYKMKESFIISIEKNHKILYGNNFNGLIK